jgi:hypothetical protein
MRRIFNERTTISTGDFDQSMPIAGMPVQMNWHDRGQPLARMQRPGSPVNSGGINVQRIRFYIHKNEPRTHLLDDMYARAKGHVTADDCGAGSDAQSRERNVQGGRPRIQRKSGTRANKAGELLFELLGSGTACDPPRPQRRNHLSDFFLSNCWY